MNEISSARTYRSGTGAPPAAPSDHERVLVPHRPWWTLSRTVAAVTAVVLAAVALTGVFLYSASSHLATEARLNRQDFEPASTRAVSLLVDYQQEEVGVTSYVLSADPGALGPLVAAQHDIPGLQGLLTRELGAVPGAAGALAQVQALHTAWEERFVEPELALVAGGQLQAARAGPQVGLGAGLFGQVEAAFAPLQGAIAGQRLANDAHIRHVERELEAVLIGALAVLALVVGVAGYLVIEHITLPVADLAAQLAGGRRRRLRRGPSEIARLGDYAHAVRSQLEVQTQRSRRATESLRLQSPTVAALVDALAPRLDALAGLAAASRLDPAEGLLAGDWYDMLDLGGGRAGLVVGDVAGHGPVSAVLALRLRENLTTALLEAAPPAEALRRTARANALGSAELFATVFVAVVDVRAGSLSYANAGHPPGLLHPGGPGPVRELGPTGPLLSPIMAEAEWATTTLPLGPGAGLLVVTDGAIEGRDREGDEYGTDRLAEALGRRRAGTPTEVVDELAADNDEWVGQRRADDRTLLYVRAGGGGERER